MKSKKTILTVLALMLAVCLGAAAMAEEPADSSVSNAAKEAANDPLAAIRDSLDRIERDITETIEENRVETV